MDALVDLTEEVQADLLVVGNVGLSTIAGRLLGTCPRTSHAITRPTCWWPPHARWKPSAWRQVLDALAISAIAASSVASNSSSALLDAVSPSVQSPGEARDDAVVVGTSFSHASSRL